ncbi:hypothetical protein I317_01963 [Kwoniella heveanensis CBS 569]|nr:hypothetical protein I317_01963 [Kwoniella heveanensis CBS 569]
MSAEDVDAANSSVDALSAELSTINVQLINHGWAKKPLDLSALGKKEHNEAVGVLFELLGSNVNKVNTLEAMASRHRTIAYENERLTKGSNSLRSQVVRAESEMAAWKVRCAELEKKLALEEGRTKELREELGRSRKATEGVRIAAGHEIKKIQLKLDKTLSQLTRANDSGPSQKSQGLILLNPIPAGRIQPVAATQSPLLEQTLRDLVDIRESLQEETEAFRHVVVSTANGLLEALAASRAEEPPARLLQTHFFSQFTSLPRFSPTATQTTQSSSSTSHPSIANMRLQTLVADVRQKLTEGVPQWTPHIEGSAGPTPEEIEEQKRIEREQEKMRRDLEDRVKDLEVEIVCAKQREEEAGRVVEEMARKELEHVTAKGEMDEGFRKQRELLDVERRHVAEIKARFEQERKQFETDRQAFTEQKRQADVDAVLAMLPTITAESTDSAENDADVVGVDAVIEGHQPVPSAIPTSPGPSTWHAHLPQSPSPLSPAPLSFSPHGKLRTPNTKPKPKHHLASRRKSVKTPLSRLVLEKALRQTGKEKAETERSGGAGGNVLGAERGRKINLASSSSSSAGNAAGRAGSPSRKGKDGAALGAGSAPSGSTSTRTIARPEHAAKMGSSTSTRSSDKPRSSAGSTTSSTSSDSSNKSRSGAHSGKTESSRGLPAPAGKSSTTTGLRQSTSSSLGVSASVRSQNSEVSERTGTSRKMDLGKVGGMGPRAAAAKKGVWR